jgi:hypothetical protein
MPEKDTSQKTVSGNVKEITIREDHPIGASPSIPRGKSEASEAKIPRKK